MFQAIQIETQAEQQGLAPLCAQRTSWRANRELALHRTEQCFDQGPTPIEPSRECPSHLGPHSVHAPSFLAALGGDHALRARAGAGCRCDSSRCRIRRRPEPVRCGFARQPLRPPQANSRNRSTGRAARVATTRTADPNPRRPPISASAAAAAVFARDDAGAAQRRC